MDDFPDSPTVSAQALPRRLHEDEADRAWRKARWERPALRRLAMGRPADRAKLNAEDGQRRS
jgi:hypothetical protein